MPTLDLVMIVRDEARAIERCLNSARPWVDAMLVLDTGSTDDTVERAQRAGALVHRFEWIDDFAAARNAALRHSDADWRLVLDADEWIERGADALAAWRGHALDHVGVVQVCSAFDLPGGALGEAPSWLPRLLPRGALYTGRIHEQPDLALPRRRLPLVLGHDGYREAQLQAKAGRNEILLRRALAEQPDDAYLTYQLGKDLELRQQFTAAAPLYLQAHSEGDPRAAWRHDLVLRLIYTLKMTRQFEAAMQVAECEMPRWPQSPDFCFTLGDLLLDWAVAEPARGAELLPMIEAAWLQAIEIGENDTLHDSVRGRGSYLAAHNLAVLNQTLGRTSQAHAWRERERTWRLAAGA